MPLQPVDKPLNVDAVDGEVMVDGAGCTMSLTPDAALKSADSLYAAATLAIGRTIVAKTVSLRPDLRPASTSAR